MAQLKDTIITGKLTVSGIITGDVTGNVTGNVTGDITGEAAATESKLTAEVARAKAAEKSNADNLDTHKNDKENPHEVTKAQVGLSDVDNKSFKTMAQALFDMEHPVGKKGRIIQYPWDDEPKIKYNNNLIKSNWEIVTEYNGRFFKIDSTKNAGTPTAESLPNIKGILPVEQDYESSTKSGGCFTKIPGTGFAHSSGWTSSKGIYMFNANKTLNSNSATINNPAYKDPVNGVPVKVQPDNISIKVWERTA